MTRRPALPWRTGSRGSPEPPISDALFNPIWLPPCGAGINRVRVLAAVLVLDDHRVPRGPRHRLDTAGTNSESRPDYTDVTYTRCVSGEAAPGGARSLRVVCASD
jgi:hypothetical protein